MTKRGTKDHDPAVKARAETLFRLREEQNREGRSALDDYAGKAKAGRAKTAKLKALRLAAEAKASDGARNRTGADERDRSTAGREGDAVNPPPRVKSPVAKRSVFIGPRKTSITLETSFWGALKEIAASQSLTVGQVVTRIDADRQHANLSSAVRLYVLDHYRRPAEAQR